MSRPSPRDTLHPVPRLWRATRASLHVASAIAVSTFVLPLVRPSARNWYAKRWSRRLLKILRIEARVHGAIDPRAGNLLIVANHISWLDIFVLNAHRPARFVAKAELARWPLAGRMIRNAGTIFIERERRHDTRRVNDHAAQALAGGEVVAVFPEGTTSDGTSILKFHSSLLQPIIEARGHLLPVALRYRTASGEISTAPAYVGEETFAQSFWRICGEPALSVEIHAAPALPASDSHRRELAQAAEEAIRTALALPARATGPGKSADPPA